jgi:secreted PhoX family phosphatase
MPDKAYHVVYGIDDTWKIRTSGATRASRTFNNQSEAIKNARVIARKAGTVLFIHTEDGRIRDREIYTNVTSGADSAIVVQEDSVEYAHRTRARKVGRELAVPAKDDRIIVIATTGRRKKTR